jgi:hypothetical protein
LKEKKSLILVIDGQGGGVGKAIIERLRSAIEAKEIPPVYIRSLGTNSAATARMMKAGADDGATGENAIIFNAPKADYIIGAMGIVMPNAILGELSPAMAEAIGASDGVKILIPIDKCHTRIAMVSEGTLGQYIDKAIQILREDLQES